MKAERIFDLLVWLFIAVVGLVAAYICFGILSSEASGQFQQYSVGGAIAGALISWSVLTSVYLQLRGSSNELRELRDRTKILQHKIIRGAPRPPGFTTEVDERQRIVLARPEEWKPKGGTVFDLELSNDNMKSGDTFAAAFRCYYVPIDKKSTPTRKEYYEKELKLIEKDSEKWQCYSHEIIQLGGEPKGIDSLKLIARQFVRTSMKRSKETGQIIREWEVISLDQAAGRIYSTRPCYLIVGIVEKLHIFGHGFRKGAVVYINDQERETQVVNEGEAIVTLIEEDVETMGTIELSIVNSDIAGLRSPISTIFVSKDISGEDLGVDVTNENGTEQEKVVEKTVPMDETHAGEVFFTEEEEVVVQEISRMRVTCYHEALEKVYYFDFLDDLKDFKNSSAVFNRVLASTRFLD